MDIKYYLAPLWKWRWLLIGALVLAAASSFVVTLRQPPIYQAHTTLIIGQSINNPNPAQNQFYLEQQLAFIYANMGNRAPLREATMSALGVEWLPEYQINALPNSQLIDILVTDTDPTRAAIVANELAKQLIQRSPGTVAEGDAERQAFIQQQLSNLQAEIVETQDEIDKQNAALGEMNSARAIADAEAQISALEVKLSSLQSNYAGLLQNTDSGALNSLSVVEPAEVPQVPIGPNKPLIVAISAVLGLGLAAIGAYVMEYFEPSVQSVEEVKRLIPLPQIGQIASFPKNSDPISFIEENFLSPFAEGFRSLRTTLETLGLGKNIKLLQIVSPGAGEGKTTIAFNLALVTAKLGKRVILVDGDMRNPALTAMTNLTDELGLSDVINNNIAVQRVLKQWKNTSLGILPAGSRTEQPDAIVDSDKSTVLLHALKQMADVVIVDGPPSIIADALSLAKKVDGVMIVVRPKMTTKEAISHMLDNFRIAGVNQIGYVVNNLPLKATYYGSYYHSEKTSAVKKKQAEKPKVELPEKQGKSALEKRAT